LLPNENALRSWLLLPVLRLSFSLLRLARLPPSPLLRLELPRPELVRLDERLWVRVAMFPPVSFWGPELAA
jgi:hypothetical protein